MFFGSCRRVQAPEIQDAITSTRSRQQKIYLSGLLGACHCFKCHNCHLVSFHPWLPSGSLLCDNPDGDYLCHINNMCWHNNLSPLLNLPVSQWALQRQRERGGKWSAPSKLGVLCEMSSSSSQRKSQSLCMPPCCWVPGEVLAWPRPLGRCWLPLLLRTSFSTKAVKKCLCGYFHNKASAFLCCVLALRPMPPLCQPLACILFLYPSCFVCSLW